MRNSKQTFLFILFVSILNLWAFNSANAQDNPCHQSYPNPNISGELLLENDKVVIQRFIFPPGEWEGIHAHPPDQIYIHVKGGEWAVKYGNTTYPDEWSETGSVGWYGPVSLDEKHESVNSGDEPIDLIWITLKQGCLE